MSAFWRLLSLLSLPHFEHRAGQRVENSGFDPEAVRRSPHPVMKPRSGGIVSDALEGHPAVKGQPAGFSGRRKRFVGPCDVRRRQAERILKDLPEYPFAADLPVNARYAAGRLVRGVHHRFVEAEPAVERVAPVKFLKVGKRQPRTSALPELRPVGRAYAHGVQDRLQIFSIVRRHGIMPSAEREEARAARSRRGAGGSVSGCRAGGCRQRWRSREACAVHSDLFGQRYAATHINRRWSRPPAAALRRQPAGAGGRVRFRLRRRGDRQGGDFRDPRFACTSSGTTKTRRRTWARPSPDENRLNVDGPGIPGVG